MVQGGSQNRNRSKNGNKSANGNQSEVKKTANSNQWKKCLEGSAEAIVIGLLLSGELALNSILVNREGNVEIILSGKMKGKKTDHAQKVAEFLNQNSEMTLADMLAGLQNYLNSN